MDAPTQPGYEVVPSRFDYPNSRVRNRPRQHGFGTKIRREGATCCRRRARPASPEGQTQEAVLSAGEPAASERGASRG
jgi:hypothetical protein